MDYLFRLSNMKNTLLVIYLLFIVILVTSIVMFVLLHGINPVLFLLTIFDLNSVIQISRAVNNSKDLNATDIAYIIINRPSSEFLFVALILFITAIFNQMIAIVAIIRRHLCLLVFTLVTNVFIFAVSVNFVRSNLFILLLILIISTIFYTIMLKQVKTNVHANEHSNHYSIIGNNTNHSASRMANNQNFSANPVETTVQMYSSGHVPSTPTDPKILAPIIYCPHYSESVC